MISGTIYDWSFDIISNNKCIIGDIYKSKIFTNGRTISTSEIKDVKIIKIKSKKFVCVETNSGSQYILINPNKIFKEFVNNCFKEEKNKEDFDFENLEGIKNIIKSHISKN